MSNNFFMEYLEIRFLVVGGIEKFMNFLKKQWKLPKFVRASHRHQPRYVFNKMQESLWAVGVTQNVTSPSSSTPPAVRPFW